MEHVIERNYLKNIILAAAHQILSTCSVEQLENAVAALTYGDPITLKPHKPVVLEDLDCLIHKITRAMAYRPRRMTKPKEEVKPSEFPNLFTVTVPMTMDTSKLSDMERQILCQNLDKVLIMTAHCPNRQIKGSVTMRARIGIPVRHLYPEQKQKIGIKEDYIQLQKRDFYKEDILALSMVFVPILHHFYETLCARIEYCGIPP